VQLARDALALLLLRRQRTPAAVAPLALEPAEHVVERVAERLDLGVGVRGRGRRPGSSGSTERIVVGQPPQRRHEPPQQDEVDRHETTKPLTMIDACVCVTGKLITIGENSSSSATIASTDAFARRRGRRERRANDRMAR
jgi:hypothetical protein